MALQQFGELVDDDEQGGQRRQVGPALTVLLVLGHPGERTGRTDLNAGLAQDRLAAVEFTGQHLTHAADEFGLLGHVGDHGGGVRKLLHTQERRATFEVGEQKVDLVGAVGGRQRQDQRAQEFGLTRPGGSDEHAVRAGAELRALLDVEVHHLAGLEFMAERDTQTVLVLVGVHLPTLRQHFGHAGGADQLMPFGGDLLLLDARPLVDDGAGGRPPRQFPGDPGGLLG